MGETVAALGMLSFIIIAIAIIGMTERPTWGNGAAVGISPNGVRISFTIGQRR